jgi:short-subunit dehydrogenase
MAAASGSPTNLFMPTSITGRTALRRRRAEHVATLFDKIMPTRSFKDKTVVITGAAGGLGRALSASFGKAGAKIIGLDIDEIGLSQTEEHLQQAGISFFGLICDITQSETTHSAIHKILQKYGAIDVLINNAGISHRSAFLRTDPAVIRKVMAVNFFGAVNCTHAAMNSLVENRGQIIVISSVAGFSPLIARTGYAASKHALHGFFESLRVELKEKGVSILMVCPSFIETNIIKNALDGDGKPVRHEQVVIGKRMQPEEAAQAIFEAASKEQKLLILGATGKLAYWTHKLSPQIYATIMARQLQDEIQQSQKVKP